MSLHLHWFMSVLWSCSACMWRTCLYLVVWFVELRTEQTLIDGFRVYPFSQKLSPSLFVWQQQSPVSSLSLSLSSFPPLQHETLLSSRLSSGELNVTRWGELEWKSRCKCVDKTSFLWLHHFSHAYQHFLSIHTELCRYSSRQMWQPLDF